MNREILFRGKRLDIGEWVYGDLSVHVQNGVPYVFPADGYDSPDCYEVDPATVGQYTGITDKNGVKIFEGDIVHISGDEYAEDWGVNFFIDYIASIAFLDGGFCAIDGTVQEHGFRRYTLASMDFDLEIIGNIHDNPELLKEAAP